MKKLIYQIAGYTEVFNEETETIEKQISLCEVIVENPTDEDIAKASEIAYNGVYQIEGENTTPIAFRNITAGEYFTINGALYKATSNIPNGETVINGQNAITTTIEAQLAELAKGE